MADTPSQCIFCQIVSGQASSRKLYEDEKVLAILDIVPRFARGQCLVISKRHVEQFYDLDDDEVAQLFKVVKLIARKLKEAFSAKRVCIFTRGGTVPHTHVIMFPSSDDSVFDKFIDTMITFAVLGREVTDDKLDAVAQRIREATPGV
jgi:histidine triad (HIT) family protein